MALPHPHPGDVIDAGPLGERLATTASHAVLKTGALELMRVVLRAGQSVPAHAVDAEATLHCVEGAVRIAIDGVERPLQAGQLIVVSAGMRYALHAERDASLLVTMLLPYRGSASATSPG